MSPKAGLALTHAVPLCETKDKSQPLSEPHLLPPHPQEKSMKIAVHRRQAAIRGFPVISVPSICNPFPLGVDWS